MDVTLRVSQVDTSWLNDEAPWNIDSKDVLLGVEPDKNQANPGVPTPEAEPLLNAVAPSNSLTNDVTLPTSHELMFWLNANAPLNMSAMFVADAVFQESEPLFVIPLLNARALRNILEKSVTFETSHEEMFWLK
mgnify:CR=1 FL=1